VTKTIKREDPMQGLDDGTFAPATLELMRDAGNAFLARERSRRRQEKLKETKNWQKVLEIAREMNHPLGPSKPTFSDDSFERIERKLGLVSPDDKLRERLTYEVQGYCLDTVSPIAYKTVRHAVLRRKLKEIKDAANSLREKLYAGNKVIPLGDRPVAAAVVNWLQTADIGWDDIVRALDRLCSVIDAQEKSKGGRPTQKAWNHMMSTVMTLYRQKTGKRPTVTENEHRAGVGERYSGLFVSIAAIVDRAAASYTGTRPLSNSTLGARLRRLQRKLSAS
jgi:hypothetical protein